SGNNPHNAAFSGHRDFKKATGFPLVRLTTRAAYSPSPQRESTDCNAEPWLWLVFSCPLLSLSRPRGYCKGFVVGFAWGPSAICFMTLLPAGSMHGSVIISVIASRPAGAPLSVLASLL